MVDNLKHAKQLKLSLQRGLINKLCRSHHQVDPGLQRDVPLKAHSALLVLHPPGPLIYYLIAPSNDFMTLFSTPDWLESMLPEPLLADPESEARESAGSTGSWNTIHIHMRSPFHLVRRLSPS